MMVMSDVPPSSTALSWSSNCFNVILLIILVINIPDWKQNLHLSLPGPVVRGVECETQLSLMSGHYWLVSRHSSNSSQAVPVIYQAIKLVFNFYISLLAKLRSVITRSQLGGSDWVTYQVKSTNRALPGPCVTTSPQQWRCLAGWPQSWTCSGLWD